MAIWPIFCVARSSRIAADTLLARALKIGQIADGGMPPTYETMHQTQAEMVRLAFLTRNSYNDLQ